MGTFVEVNLLVNWLCLPGLAHKYTRSSEQNRVAMKLPKDKTK